MKLQNSTFLAFLLTISLQFSLRPQNVLCVQIEAPAEAQESGKCTTNGVSTLRPVLERVFSRKKRFLLMPQKGRVKFTCSLSKRLLAVVPSGFNFNLEAAVYYPMITNRIDLIPKRLRPKTTTTPKPRGPTTPLIVHIPGSLIRYKAKPAAKPAKVQRIDESGQTLQWIDTPTSQQHYAQPQKWAQWAKYGSVPGQQAWTSAQQPQSQQSQRWPSKWSKWTTPMPLPLGAYKWQQQTSPWSQNTSKWWHNSNKWQQKPQSWQQHATKWQQPAHKWPTKSYNSWTHGARWQRNAASTNFSDAVERLDSTEELSTADQPDLELDEALQDAEPLYAHFPDLEPHEDWKHYHSHRDRRQLYYQFEGLSKILGIDFKSCIMRAICDCKRFLLPPGYSLVQDVLRLMFTFPTRDGLMDDYSHIVQLDYESCDRKLRAACPFNMLNWLMGNEKN